MDAKHVALLLVAVLFLYLSYLIIAPFLSFLVLGLILAFLLHPFFRRLAEKIGETWAALLTLLLTLLLIILPAAWLTVNLVAQASNAYQLLQQDGITLGAPSIAGPLASLGINAEVFLGDAFNAGRSVLAAALPSIISRTGELMIGMVMLFLVLYYALKDGKDWYHVSSNALPLKASYKRRLQEEVALMTKALFFGQVLNALLIGIAEGILFALFGVSNPVFWGFLMMILSLLPVVGAPLIYVPAGIILMLSGSWAAGVSIIVLGTVVLLVIENVIRPKIVSNAAKIHPLTVVIGAFGGVYVMGFVGFLIGPLILNIFLTLTSFDYDEK